MGEKKTKVLQAAWRMQGLVRRVLKAGEIREEDRTLAAEINAMANPPRPPKKTKRKPRP